jgi:hypothetical protein
VLKKLKPDILPYKITQTMLYSYFTFQLSHWKKEETEKHKSECELTLREMFIEFKLYLDRFPRYMFHEVYVMERKKANITEEESETFEKFIEKFS